MVRPPRPRGGGRGCGSGPIKGAYDSCRTRTSGIQEPGEESAAGHLSRRRRAAGAAGMSENDKGREEQRQQEALGRAEFDEAIHVFTLKHRRLVEATVGLVNAAHWARKAVGVMVGGGPPPPGEILTRLHHELEVAEEA